MKASVYSIEGKVLKQIDLPKFFESFPRDDLVKRAVLSDESKTYQPKGNYRWAGLETSAKYRGRKEMYGAIKNQGISRLPREVQPKGRFGRVRRIPSSVKGHRAHPPKPWATIVENMNAKEYANAMMSALAATANRKLVSARSSLEVSASLPIVIEDGFENLDKTQKVAKVMEALKLDTYVAKAKKTGTKAPLIISSGGSIIKAASNLAGVDVVSTNDLTVKLLAPGTHMGRITIYTESALKKLEGMFVNGKISKPSKVKANPVQKRKKGALSRKTKTKRAVKKGESK